MVPYVCMHDDIKFSRIQSITVKAEGSPDLPVFCQLSRSEVSAYLDLDE